MRSIYNDAQANGEEVLPIIESDHLKKSMNDAVEAEREAGRAWVDIKNTLLVIDGEDKPYPNPYEWRGWFSRGDSKEWVEPFRRQGSFLSHLLATS